MDIKTILDSKPAGTFVMVNTSDLASFAHEVARKTVEEMQAAITQVEVNDEPVGIDEICRRFHLAKNNVKSHKWRVANAFPTCQVSRGARVLFIPSAVGDWIRQHGRQRVVARK